MKLTEKQLELLLESENSRTVVVAENQKGNSLYLDILDDKYLAINLDEKNLICFDISQILEAATYFHKFKIDHKFVTSETV